MFGYVRALKGELKVKDYELYKAVYCSLCRKLGKDYGVFARFTLSYDVTFLGLLAMSMEEGCTKIERKSCPFNPLKRCNYCKEDTVLDMPAASAMIMLYYKFSDNVADEKGFKRIKYRFLRGVFSSAYKKAKEKYPEVDEILRDCTLRQGELEKNNNKDLDTACDPTSTMLQRIFSLCSEDAKQKRVLERMGYLMGRYIYILDAACDLEEDIKKGSYNVLFFNKNCDVKTQLYFCVNEAARAFELLDIKKHKDILGNIIYLGLEDTFLKELNK